MEYSMWFYQVTAILYGIYCVKQQQRLFRNNTMYKYFVVFIANTIFCPLSIAIATIQKDAYFRPDPDDLKGNKIN